MSVFPFFSSSSSLLSFFLSFFLSFRFPCLRIFFFWLPRCFFLSLRCALKGAHGAEDGKSSGSKSSLLRRSPFFDCFFQLQP